MTIRLDNLPRTISICRSDAGFPHIPDGFPILTILDQTKLPYEEVYIHITDWREVIDAIKSLKVRGAPAIGIAGAAAMMLRSAEFVYAQNDDVREDPIDFERVFVIDETSFDPDLYMTGIEFSGDMIKKARPTAVNLEWAVDGCMNLIAELVAAGFSPNQIEDSLYAHVDEMIKVDESINRRIGQNGSALLPPNCRILTHCNAGSLATSFFGTALGVIYAAAENGGVDRVFSDETRPVGQGSRLTVWELSKAGVPVTLICDDMAATVMQNMSIDAVIVGADRIAGNGDAANKIGTFGLALMADSLNIPFYVAAPVSSFDFSISSGKEIVIEQRDSSEVLGHPIEGVDVYNPAFDVTPASLITRFITEEGVYRPDEISQIPR